MSAQIRAGFPEVKNPERAGVAQSTAMDFWLAFVIDKDQGPLQCPHRHRSKSGAQDCLLRWNDVAHADYIRARRTADNEVKPLV